MDKLTEMVIEYDEKNPHYLDPPARKTPKIKSRDIKKVANITKHKLYLRGMMSFGFKL